MPARIPVDRDRPPEERYRLYARKGDDLRELACAPSPAGLGVALVQLHEDGKADNPKYRLYEEGMLGVLDGEAHEWIILPWPRGGPA